MKLGLLGPRQHVVGTLILIQIIFMWAGIAANAYIFDADANAGYSRLYSTAEPMMIVALTTTDSQQ